MAAGVPKPLFLDLSTARRAELMQVSGQYLKIIEASSDLARASIGFDNQISDSSLFTLKDGATFKADFRQIYINNAAQAGEWMRVLVTDGEPDAFSVDYGKDVSLSGVLDGIDGTVEVARDGGEAFSSPQVNVGTAATLIVAANPSRRKVTLVVPRSFSGTLHLGKDNTVTTANGCIEGGSGLEFDTRSAIYGCTSSGSVSISVFEEGA